MRQSDGVGISVGRARWEIAERDGHIRPKLYNSSVKALPRTCIKAEENWSKWSRHSRLQLVSIYSTFPD